MINNSISGKEKIITFSALAVFLLNDFFFLANKSTAAFYLFDYIFKGLLTAAILLNACKLENGFDFFKSKGIKRIRLFIWIFVLTVAGLLINKPVRDFFSGILPTFSFQLYYPVIQNPVLKTFDLFIGLALVAFSEEYIFRYSLVKIFDRVMSPVLSAAVVILLFGLAHWSFGPAAILCTALWGILPLVSVKRLNTLVPAMIAHFVTNYVAFSGLWDRIFGS